MAHQFDETLCDAETNHGSNNQDECVMRQPEGNLNSGLPDRPAAEGSDKEKPKPSRILPLEVIKNTGPALGKLRHNHTTLQTASPKQTDVECLKWGNKISARSTPDLLAKTDAMWEDNFCYAYHCTNDTQELMKNNFTPIYSGKSRFGVRQTEVFEEGCLSAVEALRTSGGESPVEELDFSSISIVENSSLKDLLLDTTLVPTSPKEGISNIRCPMNSTVVPLRANNIGRDFTRGAPVNSTMMPMHSTAISQLEESSPRQQGPLPRRRSPDGRSHSLLAEELEIHSVSPVRKTSTLSVDCWDVHPESLTDTAEIQKLSPVRKLEQVAASTKTRSLSGSFYVKNHQNAFATPTSHSSKNSASPLHTPSPTKRRNSTQINEGTPPDGHSNSVQDLEFVSNKAVADSQESHYHNVHLFDSHLVGQRSNTNDSMAVHTSFSKSGPSIPNYQISSENLSSLQALSPSQRTTMWLSGSQYIHLAKGNKNKQPRQANEESSPCAGNPRKWLSSWEPASPKNTTLVQPQSPPPPLPPRRHPRVGTLIAQTVRSMNYCCSDSELSDHEGDKVDLLSGLQNLNINGLSPNMRRLKTPKRLQKLKTNKFTTVRLRTSSEVPPTAQIETANNYFQPPASNDTIISNTSSVHCNKILSCLPKKNPKKYCKNENIKKPKTRLPSENRNGPFKTLCVV